jgi:hypothetical protein
MNSPFFFRYPYITILSGKRFRNIRIKLTFLSMLMSTVVSTLRLEGVPSHRASQAFEFNERRILPPRNFLFLCYNSIVE